MAAIATMTRVFAVDSLNGVHQPGDNYKVALYTSAAGLTLGTQAYTTDNEVVGSGYTAGGQSLTGRSVTLDGNTAVIDFNDAVWANSTIAARGAMIYNASKSNKALAVFDFGEVRDSRNAPFSLRWPAPTASTGVLVMEVF